MKILEQGERLVWQSHAGGRAGYSQGAMIAGFLVTFCAMSSLCTFPLTVGAMGSGDTRDLVAGSLNLAVFGLPALLMLVYWAIPRARPSFFLTDRDLVARRVLGGWERYPLSELRRVERYVVNYHGRYGPQEIMSDRIALILNSRTGTRQVLFGPTKDVDYLLDLLRLGVLSDEIDLSMLPAEDGSPAPAESRGDFFVCPSSSSDGFDYGPLFVGPTKIVRFTEPLGAELLGRLYTGLGRAEGPGAAEQAVMQIARNPSTGHYVELARGETATELDGRTLTLRGAQTSHTAELPASAAPRLRDYLTLSKRAPDGR